MPADAEHARDRMQSVRNSLAQKAALPPFSSREWVLWLSFVVLVQSLWGLWAVCTRYMQTVPPDPAPTLQLAAMINVIALPSTMIVGHMPSLGAALWKAVCKWKMWRHSQQAAAEEDCHIVMVHDLCSTQGRSNKKKSHRAAIDPVEIHPVGHYHHQQQQKEQQKEEVVARPQQQQQQQLLQLQGLPQQYLQDANSSSINTCAMSLVDGMNPGPRDKGACCDSTSMGCHQGAESATSKAASGDQQQHATQQEQNAEALGQSWATAFKAFCRRQAIPSAIGLLAALYNFANLYSARFINAYLVQLVFLFAPISISMCSSILLKQKRPPGLFVTLFVAIGGSAMVIAGKWIEGSQKHGADSESGKAAVTNLIIGLVLSVVSVLLLTAYMIALQIFRSSTTSEQLLIANRNFSLLLFLPLAFGVEGTEWRWLHTMRPSDWGVLLFSVVIIYTLNNYWLQVCTRRVGASMFSVFISLRLVSSVIGSIVLMQDTPQSPITWAGFAVVIAVMTAFLVYQQLHGIRTRTTGVENVPR